MDPVILARIETAKLWMAYFKLAKTCDISPQYELYKDVNDLTILTAIKKHTEFHIEVRLIKSIMSVIWLEFFGQRYATNDWNFYWLRH
jgi:hypothetical protein